MVEELYGKERTLLMIKPDGVKRRLIGRIITRVEEEDFEIIELRLMRLRRDKAESLYSAHKGKHFYSSLIDFITSGSVVVLILERADGLRYLRKIVGATNPLKAQEGTLRKEFGTDVQKNVVHAAETKEDAAREIEILFGTR